MDLKKILSISGKPGLYNMVAQTKNGIVVESITDGKRFTAFAHERMSALEEISIYTDDEDLPLRDVLKNIYEKENGKKSIDPSSSTDELAAYFGEVAPGYDKEKVYKSDIKKVFKWYNLLAEKGLLDFTDDNKEEEEKETADTKEPEEQKKDDIKEEKSTDDN